MLVIFDETTLLENFTTHSVGDEGVDRSRLGLFNYSERYTVESCCVLSLVRDFTFSHLDTLLPSSTLLVV